MSLFQSILKKSAAMGCHMRQYPLVSSMSAMSMTRFNKNSGIYGSISGLRNFSDQVYVEQGRSIRLPYTNDEAGKILMNWQFVKGNKFLMSLRESYVIYGRLTDRQLEGLRNVLQSRISNKNYSAFRAFYQIDPITSKLLRLTDDELSTLRDSPRRLSNGDTFDVPISKWRSKALSGGSLTHKQLKFAASILKQVFKDEFNINGKVGTQSNQSQSQNWN